MANPKRKLATKLATGEERIGQERPVTIALEGPAAFDQEPIQVVDGPAAMAKADELAFMEEMVTIEVHESTDPNAENPVQVGINGRMVYIPRGVTVMVRRKYVERLARAKMESYKQALTEADPVKFNTLAQRVALTYGFVVHKDTPRGVDWLRHILAQPQ